MQTSKSKMIISRFLETVNNLKLSSFKSGKNMQEIWDGPYRGFGYSSLISDPLGVFF